MSEECREEFENNWKDTGWSLERQGNGYSLPDTNNAWIGWRECWNHRHPEAKPQTWREVFASMPQCPQRQDSVDEQLRDLERVANKLGFYDASDYISAANRYIRSKPEANPLTEEQLRLMAEASGWTIDPRLSDFISFVSAAMSPVQPAMTIDHIKKVMLDAMAEIDTDFMHHQTADHVSKAIAAAMPRTPSREAIIDTLKETYWKEFKRFKSLENGFDVWADAIMALWGKV